ncbi:hypothetical protein [Spirosoma sp. KNUC1025]|uniref:hypothetical protein n=1 Tax=Spirosoma sp. KNUC1025 TaxID=2894082 RepID=UPI003866FC5B|nr:hypothetical protein LN737_09840 [Spirosoma sp. KNUC1025]
MKIYYRMALGLLLFPLLLRLTSPSLYTNGLGDDPYAGPFWAILLDISSMWLMLVFVIIYTRVIRWFRSRA